MDRDALLAKLTALDFMSVDLGLYLDTHPDDKEAIAQYNQIIEAANMVREKYEELYGPLCSFRSVSRNKSHFIWTENPWPWDKSFNFQLSGEGCR